MTAPSSFKKCSSGKSFEIYFDDASERFVFDIHDMDGMLPLVIRGLGICRAYELVITRNGKLQLR